MWQYVNKKIDGTKVISTVVKSEQSESRINCTSQPSKHRALRRIDDMRLDPISTRDLTYCVFLNAPIYINIFIAYACTYRQYSCKFTRFITFVISLSMNVHQLFYIPSTYFYNSPLLIPPAAFISLSVIEYREYFINARPSNLI